MFFGSGSVLCQSSGFSLLFFLILVCTRLSRGRHSRSQDILCCFRYDHKCIFYSYDIKEKVKVLKCFINKIGISIFSLFFLFYLFFLSINIKKYSLLKCVLIIQIILNRFQLLFKHFAFL